MRRPEPKGVKFRGNDKYEGFTIDLLNRISKDLKFNYKIILSPNNEYGGPRLDRERDSTKAEWGGIVGEILAQVIIVSCNNFSIKVEIKISY